MVSGDGLMPRYDFDCQGCGMTRMDVWVSNFRDATETFDASQLVPCGNCGGKKWTKLPCAPNFNVTGFNAKNHYGAKHE